MCEILRGTYGLNIISILSKSGGRSVLSQTAHEDVKSFRETNASVSCALELATVNEERVDLIEHARVNVHASLVVVWITTEQGVIGRGWIVVACWIVHVTNAYMVISQ
jgi:hypothetical protein